MEIVIGFIFDIFVSVICSGSVCERVGVIYLLLMLELLFIVIN